MDSNKELPPTLHFQSKSISELLLAVCSQLSAHWNRGGAENLLQEVDVVVTIVLTAMTRKCYSMW
jgi:hypothetical protein